MTYQDDNPKDRIGRAKPAFSAIPAPPLVEVGAVFLCGARKYGRHNWRAAGIAASVYFDAALRHLFAWYEGEDLDPETGLSHLSHAVAGLMIARDAQLRGMMVDDRPPATPDLFGPIAARTAEIISRFPEPAAPITAASVAPRPGCPAVGSGRGDAPPPPPKP